MSRDRSLRMLRLLRNAREREAARSVARTSASEAEERARLEALEAWQRDYVEYQRALLADGRMARVQLGMWRGFIGQLRSVIEQQREVVRNCGRETGERERDWLTARTELAVVDHLDTRAEDEKSRADEHREQAESDEASRRRRRR